MAKNSTKVGALKALASFLGLKVNIEDEGESQTIVTADGSSFTLYKAEGEPAVGDSAEPDGEYTLEDGRIVVIADGEISEIKEAEPEGNPAPVEPVNEGDEDLKAENEALKAENDELKAKVAELEEKLAETEKELPSEEDKAIVKKVNLCGGMAWLTKVAKSDYTPAGRKTISQTANNAGISKTEARLAELRERANRK